MADETGADDYPVERNHRRQQHTREYPRPQMEREEWLNLNGVWDLRKAVEGEAYQADFTYDKKILVPFPIESAPLRHHGRKRQPMLLVPANPDHTGKHEREKHPIAFRCRGLGSHGL